MKLMSTTFKRTLIFAFCGLITMLLAGVFLSVLLGTLITLLANNPNTNFVENVSETAGGISFLTLGLSLLLFSLAGWLTRKQMGNQRHHFKILVLRCFNRCAWSVLALGLIGSLITTVMGQTTNWLDAIIPPKYALGLIAGMALGFFVGQIWGIIEGVRFITGKTVATPRPGEVPPIAMP